MLAEQSLLHKNYNLNITQYKIKGKISRIMFYDRVQVQDAEIKKTYLTTQN